VLATRLKTGIAKGKSVVILRLSCNRSDLVDAAAITDDEEDENKLDGVDVEAWMLDDKASWLRIWLGTLAIKDGGSNGQLKPS
jgi:hypothetical protein